MTRSLIVVSASLVAVVSLALGSSDVEARHYHGRYQNDCCQPVNTGGCQQNGYATYQSGRSNRYRHNGYYHWQQNGSAVSQQTAGYTPETSYVTPVTYNAPATAACCTPQPTCCAGAPATVAPATPVNSAAPQPFVNEAPAPAPGN